MARRSAGSGALRAALMATLVAAGCGQGGAPEATPPAPGAPGSSPTADQAGSPAGVGNRPPEIQGVQFEPSRPKAGDRVHAVVHASDPDGDAITLHYRWQVGARVVETLSPELPDRELQRGERATVVVTADDGRKRSAPVQASVAADNQPPILATLVFEPLGEITAGHDVVVRPEAMDPDGDPIEFRYTWKVNGSLLAVDGNTLPASRFGRDDTVSVRVVASDGVDESNVIQSPPIPVANAAPRIVSQPLGGLDGGEFRYAVQVEDPDGDITLNFLLVEGPRGMSIDYLTGHVQWVPTAEQRGRFPVEIAVDDTRGGRTVQRFQVDVGEGDVPAALAD